MAVTHFKCKEVRILCDIEFEELFKSAASDQRQLKTSKK